MADEALKINYKTPKLKLVKSNNVELILLPPKEKKAVSKEDIANAYAKLIDLLVTED